jgi:hypothetical protein
MLDPENSAAASTSTFYFSTTNDTSSKGKTESILNGSAGAVRPIRSVALWKKRSMAAYRSSAMS